MAGTSTGRNPLGWVIDHPWSIILLAGVIALGFWIKSTRTSDYEVQVMFEEAASLYSGLDVRVDGLDAGKIKKITQRDGRAVVTLGLRDDRIYPLHEGTTATLRYGTTIGNGTRQIDLEPGPKSNPEIPDGGIIDNKFVSGVTEFDQVFDTFDEQTRGAFQGAMKGTAETFGPRPQALGDGVDESAEGLKSVSGFANDLAADTPALRALVANTNRVMRTLSDKRSDLSNLVGVASSTFDEFADNTRGITGSLDRFPTAQRETRTTLARLDSSLDGLDQLFTDLRPGAKELSGLSRDLRPALADLRETIPSAVAAFRTGRDTAPGVTTLLREAQPFSAKATPALTDLAPMVACVRPFAPEIGALMTTWTSFTQSYDRKSHIGRLFANVGATSFTDTPVLDADDLDKLGLQNFALARPPGFNAGKPKYLPECGLTERYTTASQDPEAGK